MPDANGPSCLPPLVHALYHQVPSGRVPPAVTPPYRPVRLIYELTKPPPCDRMELSLPAQKANVRQDETSCIAMMHVDSPMHQFFGAGGRMPLGNRSRARTDVANPDAGAEKHSVTSGPWTCSRDVIGQAHARPEVRHRPGLLGGYRPPIRCTREAGGGHAWKRQ
jgi:hypothetical protein